MTNTVVIQEWTDNKGLIHRIEIPLMTYLTEHDLEPVVRCADCKHQNTVMCPLFVMAREYGVEINDQEYCSRGERREDAETN